MTLRTAEQAGWKDGTCNLIHSGKRWRSGPVTPMQPDSICAGTDRQLATYGNKAIHRRQDVSFYRSSHVGCRLVDLACCTQCSPPTHVHTHTPVAAPLAKATSTLPATGMCDEWVSYDSSHHESGQNVPGWKKSRDCVSRTIARQWQPWRRMLSAGESKHFGVLRGSQFAGRVLLSFGRRSYLVLRNATEARPARRDR